MACGLVFGGGEVEEGFIVASFVFPVANYVFDAVLFLGSFFLQRLFSVSRTVTLSEQFYDQAVMTGMLFIRLMLWSSRFN